VNVSLSTALFRSVGGFDERMSPDGKDPELGARLLKHGARFQFAAEALCVRDSETVPEHSLSRGAAEGAAFTAVVEKHIELFWKLLYNSDALERTPGRWRSSRLTERENAYWGAVRARLGSFDRWEDLFEDAPLAPEHAREIEIAIPDDLPRLDEIFAARQADSVNVICRGEPLGRLSPEAGAGALSGAHVREQIENRFSHVLLGLVVAQRSGRKDSGAAVAGERFTGVTVADTTGNAGAEMSFSWTEAAIVPTRIVEFELARPTHIWGLEDFGALYLLIRNNGLPIAIHRSLISDRRVIAKQEVLSMLAGVVTESTAMNPPPALSTPKQSRDLPPISVVVCTRNRPHALNRCLAALLGSRYREFEVVVIDYGSGRQETFEGVSSPAVRVIRADAAGIESARNRGAAESRYDTIAYVDETAVADPDWLKAIGSTFIEPHVDAVTGMVLPAELSYLAQHLYEQFGPAPRYMSRLIFEGSLMEARGKIRTDAIGTGANMAFRRSALARVGGFDAAFERIAARRSCGELDVFHRMLVAGMNICYEPAALVWQRYPRSERRQREEFRDWQRGSGMYLLKVFAAATVPRKAVLAYIWREWFGGRLRRSFRSSQSTRNRAFRRTSLAELRGAAGSLRAYAVSRHATKVVAREVDKSAR
jgi:glycosyltransferase involved in cell wall biosynthesis